MQTESIRVSVPHAGVDWVSAILDRPEEDLGRGVLLLASGAGAPMDSGFLTAVAEGLCERGFPVMRFNYVYDEIAAREGKRRPPDVKPRLLEAHRAALLHLREQYPQRPLVLAGKSMGGRMSTYLAAEGTECAGLALFGYPLHPPGKPEKLRSDHFPAIGQPALFLQGDRDALGDAESLRRELEAFGGKASLEVIEGANHDFGVTKKTGKTRDEVIADLVERFEAWERQAW